MYRVTALSRAAVFACLGASLSFLSNPSAQAHGPDRSWTGFYIGAHGSYNWADIEFPKAPPHPAGPPRQTLEGGFIGGQIGYNYQINSLVLGVEADLSKGNITGSVRDGNYIVQTDTIDWTGSLRGRLGYAMGTFMPYLTAGWMWDRGTRGQSCPDPGAVVGGSHCNAANGFSPYNLSQSQNPLGLRVGRRCRDDGRTALLCEG
jgi:outer membrane immunogenic protein